MIILKIHIYTCVDGTVGPKHASKAYFNSQLASDGMDIGPVIRKAKGIL